MTKLSYTVEVEITDDVLMDIVIDMAGYGMRYWAVGGLVDEDNRRYTVKWWDERRIYTDSDYTEPESKTTSFDDIVAVIGKIASGTPIKYLDDGTRAAVASFLVELQAGEQYPGGDIDGNAADQIVQVALFDEVIFG